MRNRDRISYMSGWNDKREPKTSWFVVETKSRQEALAVDNLRRQNYKVLCPRLVRRKRSRGRWCDVEEAMFPGYLFVALTLGEDDSAPIKSTIGCKGLVKFGGYPRPVPREIILPLIGTDEVPIKVDADIKPGDGVHIESGPLQGLEAVFATRKGRDRAILLLSLMLPFLQFYFHLNLLD